MKRKQSESLRLDLPTKDLIALLARFSLEEEGEKAEKVLQELRSRRVSAKDLTTKAGEVVTCRLVMSLSFTVEELLELLTIQALAPCAWRRIVAHHNDELDNGLAREVMTRLRFINPLNLREEIRTQICGLSRPASRAAV